VRIHLEQLSLLRQELLVGWAKCQQPPVFAAVRTNRYDQPRVRMGRGPAVQQLVDVLGDALLFEPLLVAVQLASRADLYGQQVPHRPDLECCSGGDPGEHVVEVVRRDQIGRGREHAA
jgi:hypothetical protein